MGYTINLDTTKYAGEIIWSSREDLAGYDGDIDIAVANQSSNTVSI